MAPSFCRSAIRCYALSERIFPMLVIATALLLNQLIETSSACPVPPPAFGDLRLRSVDLPLPRTGEYKMLVIAVDFPDAAGTVTLSAFARQMFGDYPTGSFSHFYSKASYGQLEYTGDVMGISGGVVVKNVDAPAFVRMPHTKSYYTDGASGLNVNAIDRSFPGLYRDAIDKLVAAGADLSPYADSSGRLRNVVVIFQGSSSVETRSLTDFQPTAFRLGYYFTGGYKVGGYSFDEFTFCPEKALAGERTPGQASLGVCVHEHGHALGLPDLYDLGYTTSGAGYFDLMAYGVYTDFTAKEPSSFAAPMKEELGWISPSTVTIGGEQTFTLRPLSAAKDALKIVPIGASVDEYFLVENRQAAGLDSSFPQRNLCGGVYIWHVDRAGERRFLVDNKVNSLPSAGGPSHPSISVAEADGGGDLGRAPISYGSCQDAFSVGSEFSDDTPATARLWSGARSGIRVAVVSQQTTVEGVTYQVRVNGTSTEPPPSATEIPAPTASPVATPATGKIVTKVRARTISGTLSSVTTIGGVSVSLFRQVGNRYKYSSASVTTATGTFSFKRLGVGTYQVRIGSIRSKKLIIR